MSDKIPTITKFNCAPEFFFQQLMGDKVLKEGGHQI